MRIGAHAEETRKLWSALPALAASAPLGGPRPGATVLAVTTAPGGGVFPVVAVQRYGQRPLDDLRRRSVVALEDDACRRPIAATNSSGGRRRAGCRRARPIRWRLPCPTRRSPATPMSVDVDARDAAFAPVPDAPVDATLTAPGGATQPLKLRRVDATSGRFTAAIAPSRPGCIASTRRRERGDDAARHRPIDGCTSAAPIASSPIRG